MNDYFWKHLQKSLHIKLDKNNMYGFDVNEGLNHKISFLLGAMIVLIIGILVFNYFNKV